MKVILIFVSTLNGKITRGDDPEVRHWSSRSDQKYYSGVWKNSSLIVMGSNTWKDNTVINPSRSRLIVVMTRQPSLYKDKEIPHQLEFTDNSPSELVARFRNSGTEQMTVVGGPLVATSFLKETLIDELWLTIEPRLFGKGINLISESELDIRLKLIDMVKANEEGTLITKYSVIR